MEVALYNSQDTLVVARHLQDFEDKKRRHAQVISYAETFEKLSEDESIALMHIEQLCMQPELDGSLDVAQTLKVL